MTWQPAAVGCYWSSGPYTISTVQHGPIRGYQLTKDRRLLTAITSWIECKHRAYLDTLGEIE